MGWDWDWDGVGMGLWMGIGFGWGWGGNADGMGRYHPFCTESTNTSSVKVQKEEDFFIFWDISTGLLKAILPPSQVEFLITKLHNVTGLTLDALVHSCL